MAKNTSKQDLNIKIEPDSEDDQVKRGKVKERKHLLTGPETSKEGPLKPVTSKQDLGEFVAAAARSTEKFDLKSGFYTDDDAKPIARHHLGRHEAEEYHRRGDFPRVRHSISYKTPSHSHKIPRTASLTTDPEPGPSASKSSVRSDVPPLTEDIPQDVEAGLREQPTSSSAPDMERAALDRSTPAVPRSILKVTVHDETGRVLDDDKDHPPDAPSTSTPSDVGFYIGDLPSDRKIADSTDGASQQSIADTSDGGEPGFMKQLSLAWEAEQPVPAAAPPEVEGPRTPHKVSFHLDEGVESANELSDEHDAVELENELADKHDCVELGNKLSEKHDAVESSSEIPDKRADDDESSKSVEKLTVPDAKPEKRGSEHGHRHHHRHHGRHHHGHHHHEHIPSQQELANRLRKGSEVQLEHQLKSVDLDDSTLLDADLDELTRHRFGAQHGMRRRKMSHHNAVASIVHIGKSGKGGKERRKKSSPKQSKKPPIDRSPHEMFVELDELYAGEDNEYEWHEKARWIKFEEDVEEGADRWGKPHVASLSFHSLLELRKCIEQGAILLDLAADDLPVIANCVVEELVITDQLDESERGAVLKALLLKHRHVNDKKNFLRRNLSYINLSGLDHARMTPTQRREYIKLIAQWDDHHVRASSPKFDFRRSSSVDNSGDSSKKFRTSSLGDNPSNHKPEIIETKTVENHTVSGDQANLPTSADKADKRLNRQDPNILRRIPEGAEATNVLIGTVDFLEKPIMAFVRLLEGRYLGNLTEVPLPVRFLFVLMGPPSDSLDYHEIGRSISTLMANTSFHDIAYQADGRQDLLDAINEFLDDSIVLPPGEWDSKTLLPIMDMQRRKTLKKKKQKEEDEVLIEEEKYGDPLGRTGRLFGGMINDIKRRYPKYWSDIKDAFNLQCLATFFFIYFACLSPAITFGGLLSEKTDQWIGVSEMLTACCACGILFALLSGQPLLIIGATGPILVFEEGLYNICKSINVEYISMHFWVGVWVTVISIILVMFEGSRLVRFFTRFTEEIFASLISLIFIYETFKKLAVIFEKHPLQEYYDRPGWGPIGNATCGDTDDISNTTLMPSNLTDIADNLTNIAGNLTGIASNLSTTDTRPDEIKPNTALLSIILCMGTFLIAYSLKIFRNSTFLGRSARRALGDFGIPIAIAVMVLADYLIRDTYTEKLYVPDGMEPTNSTARGWVINPLGMEESLPVWAMFAALIPAMLVFILIFMETEISSLIVNKKSRKLRKGSGYHLDMLLIGIFGTISGLFGLPLLCAATVRSVSHVAALTYYSKTTAPGEPPKLMGVHEQRMTAVLVHIMLGVSVLLGPVLRQVPLAVLFGVFLYMGIASMSGIQLFERVELLFTPIKHHPNVGYCRRVRTWKMHLFTIIQLVCLAVLWAVKSTEAALAFPFILILMVPVRMHLLKFIFTPQELGELDCEEVEDDFEEDEPDFYTQAHMPY